MFSRVIINTELAGKHWTLNSSTYMPGKHLRKDKIFTCRQLPRKLNFYSKIIKW